MTISLGLDIGTNSVGSAWVDTEKREITVGVSIFPAGVEQSKDRRGAPKNQARRQKRSQRRTLRRRAERKRRLRELLTEFGLLPSDPDELRGIFGPRKDGDDFDLEKWNPLHLRREALQRPLERYELGRILVHMNQSRGSAEIRLDEPDQARKPTESNEEDDEAAEDDTAENDERKKATAAVEQTVTRLEGRTFGQLMADEYDARLIVETDEEDRRVEYRDPPIKNRRDRVLEVNDQTLLANRELIRREFETIWQCQQEYNGKLGKFLKSSKGLALRKKLLDPNLEATKEKERKAWREGGVIFGQRKTFWNVSTLGRCDLEPTDRCIFKIDMYAQQFRVLETVNNIRIKMAGRSRCLNVEDRKDLIDYLSRPQLKTSKKTGEQVAKANATIADVKEQLKIDKQSLAARGIPETQVESSLDALGKRDVNVDWFSRQIVHGVFGKSHWSKLKSEQNNVNRDLLRLDPESDEHAEKLKKTAAERWELNDDAIERLVAAWRDRPSLERMNLSRRAIRNLLPYMREAFTDRQREEDGEFRVYWLGEAEFDPDRHRWLTEIEARQAFAENPEAKEETSGELVRNLQRKQERDGQLVPFNVGHEVRMRYAHTVTDQLKSLVLKELHGDEERFKRAVKLRGLSKRDLHYLKRHREQILPPAPDLSNPVVRKAIHVVREHIIEHLRKHRCPETGEFLYPDQIVVELARETRQTAKVRDAVLKRNQNRNDIRKAIANKWKDITNGDPRHPAVERVLLCRQQNFTCPYSGLPKGNLSPAEEGKCVYSGKTISEQAAAKGATDDGIPLEVDHIVPRSRGGDNGLNNKVLCFAEANRRKANQTPKQSLSDDEFQALERFMQHLAKRPFDGDYFTKKDYLRKWENLHSEARPSDFRESQLAETAYASLEVGSYLRAALFPNEPHRVVFTKGSYTDILRRDWRLMQQLPDPWCDDLTDEERQRRRDLLAKNRDDHRHHAIDAVIVALTVNQREPHKDYLDRLKHELEALEEKLEQLREKNISLAANWPRRQPLLPPWPYVKNSADATERHHAWQAFRRDVLSRVYAEFDAMRSRDKGEGTDTGQPLIVSHRPQRRIYGKFHEAHPYGEASEYPGLFVTRKYITELKPGHFIEPREERDGSWKIPGRGQGLSIRDQALREDLRMCLLSGEVRVSADDFRQKGQLRSLVDRNCVVPAPDLSEPWEAIKEWLNETRPQLIVDLGKAWNSNVDPIWKSESAQRAFTNAVKIIDRYGGFRTRSGIPVRSVRLLLALSNPVPIEKFDEHHNKLVTRYFKGGNNHHLAVFEDERTGKWHGKTIPMKEVADRNRERLTALKEALTDAGVPALRELRKDKNKHRKYKSQISKITSEINRQFPLIDRSAPKGKRFKFSLAIGEMIYLRDPKTDEPEFFHVVEVKKSPKPTQPSANKVVVVPHSDARQAAGQGVDNPRTEYLLNAAQIQQLVAHPRTIKARVSALGDIRWVND